MLKISSSTVRLSEGAPVLQKVGRLELHRPPQRSKPMSPAGPASLFKLIEARYGEALVTRGEIKISTLSKCREAEEAVGIGRSEPLEHTKEVVMPPHRLMAFPENHEEPDLFVYCTSHFRTRRIERRFDSGNDVWIEIFDPMAFFSEVSKGIGDIASFSKEGPVTYGSRTFAPHDAAAGIDAAFLKGAKFEAEAEWRVLWEPRTRPIDPIIRTLPELTKYCRTSAHVLARARR